MGEIGVDKEKLVIPGFEQMAVVALVSQFCFSLEAENSKKIMNAIGKFHENYVWSMVDEEEEDCVLKLRESIINDILGEDEERQVLMGGDVGVDFTKMNDDDNLVSYSCIREVIRKIMSDRKFALAILDFTTGMLRREEQLYINSNQEEF